MGRPFKRPPIFIPMKKTTKTLFEIFCILKNSSPDQIALIEEIFIGLGISTQDIVSLSKDKMNRVSIYVQGIRRLNRLKKFE